MFPRAALLLLFATACGGKTGTIEIDIVVSPVEDPFASASSVQFTVGTMMKSVPVVGGHFSFELDQEPPANPAPIVIQGLDAMNNIVAFGQTPTLALGPVDQGPYAVWVGRPGGVAAADAALPTASTEIAAMGVTGLGVVFAGGRDATGAALKSASVYNVFTQTVIAVTDMSTARAGAAGIPSDVSSTPRAIVFGGAQSTGLLTPGGALNSGELFDPSGSVDGTGLGIWAAVPADSTPDARSQANTIVLGSGSGLISGGLGAAGAPLASALLVATGATSTFTPLSMPMVAARAHHAAAAAHFTDGDGALIIGGLADGDTSSIVERLVGQSFASVSAPGIENRWDATASPISGGVVLVGGTIPTGGTRVATKSVVLFTTTTIAAPMRYDTLLPTARAGHTANVIGTDILVCGGHDDAGNLLASCELIGTAPTVAWKKTIATGVGRTGHIAAALETGPILLAGGIGANGQPLTTIEMYTPEIATP